jgi:septal ring factor EnvC (AmiA/AmiB activator)
MWRHSLRVWWVLLFLCCCLIGARAETYYQISESELAELEAIQQRQENRIKSLENSLTERENELSEKKKDLQKKDELLMEQAQTISDLEASFDEYENVVEMTLEDKNKEIEKLRRNTVVWQVLTGIGSAAAVGLGIFAAVK